MLKNLNLENDTIETDYASIRSSVDYYKVTAVVWAGVCSPISTWGFTRPSPGQVAEGTLKGLIYDAIENE